MKDGEHYRNIGLNNNKIQFITKIAIMDSLNHEGGLFINSQSYIQHRMSRWNLRYIILNALFSLVILGYILIIHANVYNLFLGPFEMDYAKLNEIEYLEEEPENIVDPYYYYMRDPLGLQFYSYNNQYAFEITGDRFEHEDNIYMDMQIKDGQIVLVEETGAVAYFSKLYINDKVLIVKSAKKLSTTTVSGILIPQVPGLFKYINVSQSDSFFPFVLDASGTYISEFRFQFNVLLLFLGINVYFYINVVRRIKDHTRHPLLKKLARHGPIDEIIHSIDTEVSDPNHMYWFNKQLVTPNWVITPGWMGLKVERIYERDALEKIKRYASNR